VPPLTVHELSRTSQNAGSKEQHSAQLKLPRNISQPTGITYQLQVSSHPKNKTSDTTKYQEISDQSNQTISI